MKDAKGTRECERILFVEDSADDYFIAQRELKRKNICTPTDCVDSVPGMIDYLEKRQSGNAPLPCVIILDLGLRGESGLTGLARIKTSLKYRNIPVIAISSGDQLVYLKVAVEQGVRGYLLKPFNGDEFLKIAARVKLPLDFSAV